MMEYKYLRQKLGLAEIIDGVSGIWIQTRNGGIWFKPDNWKPKTHFSANGKCLCRPNDENIKRQTSNFEEVDCGSCINLIRIRNFRIIMFLAAFLLWHKVKGDNNGIQVHNVKRR